MAERLRIAVLDDYQHVALQMADWSTLQLRCDIEIFDRPLGIPDDASQALADFDIICHLRERMAMPRELIERLPRLKLITITGLVHRTLDLQAAAARGITVVHSVERPDSGRGTPELAWGLMLALARHIPMESHAMRSGGWQRTVGVQLYKKTLGLVGLGKLGVRMAEIGRAFGMDVIAWSQNLTPERAAASGVRWVSKQELFREADFISVHVVLGDRTRGLIGTGEFALMKSTAYLVNTARGPIVDEAALIAALREDRIAGAGIDVYDREPLADDHPLRTLPNALLTPHLGYCTIESYRSFYGDTVENIVAYLNDASIRVVAGTGSARP